MQERDTRYREAARSLLLALSQSTSPEESQRLIATYSWDLMAHVLAHTPSLELSLYGDDYVIDLIPDMVNWPSNGS